MLGGEFGFGLSLVGTQIGSLIDQLVTKAGALGQALNPATADVDALVEALGLVGSPTKESIDALRELAGEQAALEAATHQLSLVVGDDGVEALANLGDASTRFGNALTRVTTQVLAEVARLTGGVAQKIAEALEFEADLTAAKASKDPEMAVLQGQLANVNVFEDVISGRQRAGIEAQMVDLQRKIRAEEEASLEAAVEKARIGSVEHTIAKNNLTIAKLNGDLTNERVFRLEKANIFQEFVDYCSDFHPQVQRSAAIEIYTGQCDCHDCDCECAGHDCGVPREKVRFYSLAAAAAAVVVVAAAAAAAAG